MRGPGSSYSAMHTEYMHVHSCASPCVHEDSKEGTRAWVWRWLCLLLVPPRGPAGPAVKALSSGGASFYPGVSPYHPPTGPGRITWGGAPLPASGPHLVLWVQRPHTGVLGLPPRTEMAASAERPTWCQAMHLLRPVSSPLTRRAPGSLLGSSFRRALTNPTFRRPACSHSHTGHWGRPSPELSGGHGTRTVRASSPLSADTCPLAGAP